MRFLRGHRKPLQERMKVLKTGADTLKVTGVNTIWDRELQDGMGEMQMFKFQNVLEVYQIKKKEKQPANTYE